MSWNPWRQRIESWTPLMCQGAPTRTLLLRPPSPGALNAGSPLSVGHPFPLTRMPSFPSARAGLHLAHSICQSLTQMLFLWKAEPESPETKLHFSSIVHREHAEIRTVRVYRVKAGLICPPVWPPPSPPTNLWGPWEQRPWFNAWKKFWMYHQNPVLSGGATVSVLWLTHR